MEFKHADNVTFSTQNNSYAMFNTRGAQFIFNVKKRIGKDSFTRTETMITLFGKCLFTAINILGEKIHLKFVVTGNVFKTDTEMNGLL